jgi:hypothetical protein
MVNNTGSPGSDLTISGMAPIPVVSTYYQRDGLPWVLLDLRIAAAAGLYRRRSTTARSSSLLTCPACMQYQACLRRVFMTSSAYGGEEGVGDRIIVFEVERDDQVAVGVPDHVFWSLFSANYTSEVCGELTSAKVTVSNTGPVVVDYSVPCIESCGSIYYTLVAPSITVGTPEAGIIPSEGAVQWAMAEFNGGTSMEAPTYLDVTSQDRLWVSECARRRARRGEREDA